MSQTEAPRPRIAFTAAPSSSSTRALSTEPAALFHLPMSIGRKISFSPSASGSAAAEGSVSGSCEPWPER